MSLTNFSTRGGPSMRRIKGFSAHARAAALVLMSAAEAARASEAERTSAHAAARAATASCPALGLQKPSKELESGIARLAGSRKPTKRMPTARIGRNARRAVMVGAPHFNLGQALGQAGFDLANRVGNP